MVFGETFSRDASRPVVAAAGVERGMSGYSQLGRAMACMPAPETDIPCPAEETQIAGTLSS